MIKYMSYDYIKGLVIWHCNLQTIVVHTTHVRRSLPYNVHAHCTFALYIRAAHTYVTLVASSQLTESQSSQSSSYR